MTGETEAQSLAGIRVELRALRMDVDKLLVAASIVSLNDGHSTSTHERLVSMTDPQRVYLAAVVKNQETHSLLLSAGEAKEQFWKTRWGIASLIVGIIVGLIVAAGTIYEVVFGLSHSLVQLH